jgi:hypothetical protein
LFPERFAATGDSSFYQELKKKTKLQCRLVYEGKDANKLDLIEQINRWQLTFITPKNLNNEDPTNYINNIEHSFESLCASLEDLGIKDPGSLTIFQFYTRLAYYEKKKLKQQQNRKK